ncbi:hypothetical protein NDU88_008064 [Pleurodeles waltl]|uniref:Uncharacterized protein n=1 Tax=Pleurodeles waltl TaxID=8319 RepID=A0AAV7NUY6_PLEWA|nr:hypothetical protein NDU88_008064 [Pleurodeles waltl]
MRPPHAALDATSGNPGSPRTTEDDLTDGSWKERRTRKHRNQRTSLDRSPSEDSGTQRLHPRYIHRSKQFGKDCLSSPAAARSGSAGQTLVSAYQGIVECGRWGD